MHFKSKQTNVETKHLWSNLSRTYYHNGERTKLRGGEQRRQKKKKQTKNPMYSCTKKENPKTEPLKILMDAETKTNNRWI